MMRCLEVIKIQEHMTLEFNSGAARNERLIFVGLVRGSRKSGLLKILLFGFYLPLFEQ